MKMLAVVAFCLLSIVDAASQSPTDVTGLYRWYAQRGDYLISDIRPKFRAVLTDSDRQLENRLRYEVIVTGNTNAFARGDGTIIITSSMLQIIDSVSTVLVGSELFGKPDCLTNYVDYLAEGTRENSIRVASGKPAQSVDIAFAFWHLRPDVCGGLSEGQFRSNKQADDARELIIYSSVIYLIGHEFAHERYGDSKFVMVTPDQLRRDRAEGKDITFEVTPAEQKVKEARADTFAFQKMLEMGYTPTAALPVLIFFGGIEGFSPEAGPSADHPAAILRISEMIKAADEDPQFINSLRRIGKLQAWRAFEAQLKQYEVVQ
jgi:hypothetical protein